MNFARVAIGLCCSPAVLVTHAAAQHRAHYFVEAGGNSGSISLNLDVRAFSSVRLRAGAGLLSIWPAFPFTATLTLGRGSHSLEVGGGATVIVFPPKGESSGSLAQDFAELFLLGEGIGTVVVGTGVLGYRHEQPGGFLFRATLTPFIDEGNVTLWGGLTIGGAF